MKIVVIGGSGRIGEKLVYYLRQDDCRVLEAAPSCGVNTITGEGLAEALRDARVVVDVSNSPSLEGDAPLRFFETSGRNLLAAARAAGVKHHVALSVVGTDQLQSSAYFRAKKVQEELVKASGVPWTILRSTPFFEVISAVAQEGTGSDIAISPALMQPIAAEDLAQTLGDIALSDPLNRTVEVAGPERLRLDYLATEVLTAYEDPRRIIADPHAPYFGAELDDRSLLPGEGAVIASRRFEDWLRMTLETDTSGELADPAQPRTFSRRPHSAAQR